jgi:hypothetical protein
MIGRGLAGGSCQNRRHVDHGGVRAPMAQTRLSRGSLRAAMSACPVSAMEARTELAGRFLGGRPSVEEADTTLRVYHGGRLLTEVQPTTTTNRPPGSKPQVRATGASTRSAESNGDRSGGADGVGRRQPHPPPGAVRSRGQHGPVRPRRGRRVGPVRPVRVVSGVRVTGPAITTTPHTIRRTSSCPSSSSAPPARSAVCRCPN